LPDVAGYLHRENKEYTALGKREESFRELFDHYKHCVLSLADEERKSDAFATDLRIERTLGRSRK
jgi:hypothetical protein